MPRFMKVRLQWTDIVHIILGILVGLFFALGSIFQIVAAVICGVFFLYQGLEIEDPLSKAENVLAEFLAPALFTFAFTKLIMFIIS